MTQPLPPYSESQGPHRLLVVRLGALGDIVRTLPAVRLLRRTWPAAQIAWAVEEGGFPLVAHHPDVDRAVLLPRRSLSGGRGAGRWSAALAFLRELRSERPELALDFQGSLKSGLVSWLSGARVRAGFRRELVRERSHLFTNVRVPLDPPRVHRVERAAALARGVGAADRPLEIDLGLRGEELEEGRRRARELAAERRPVLVAPFSSRRQAWKRFPAERWCRVLEGLCSDGLRPVIVHGPGEEQDEARRMAGQCGGVPCGPTSVRELAALIASGRLMISGDTGPMHLAWASGVPVVAIYGPTDPVLNAPFGEGHAVLAPDRPTPRGAAEPYPGITAERVLETARSLLPAAH